MIQVDSFTDEPFRGNPAAVCLLDHEMDDSWMQSVAAEMNLSETAFLLRRENSEYSLKWFTPTVEMPLCGHATLASAHALREEGLVSDMEPIKFHTLSGLLTACRESDWICLDFPAIPVEKSAALAGLTEALGCQPLATYATRDRTYLVEVDSEDTVRALTPDFTQLEGLECVACIVTAPGGSGAFDFVSRFFAPRLGINEDPVTGAAHCSLAPYWTAKLGRTELVGRQVSQREGTVRVRAHEDRVDLLGQAVTIMRGEILC